ncbi:MAG: flavodoxin domain-containing protein [Elusimicrobia bacterium]|nr:flavodoxin domain-containing protein [Candidatus Liberimonas magnetica]
MKKVISFMFLSCIAATFCMNLSAKEKKEVPLKDLIVYYSYTGKTEIVAKAMASELNAELLKIDDVERPSKLKAYFSGAFASRKGKAWPIKPFNTDLSAFNRIFIGAPIWWSKAAPEINSFIEQADLSGKSVVVFVTMGSSDPEDAIKALSEKIRAKGGNVLSSFSMKTGRIKDDRLLQLSKKIASTYK